MANGPSITSGAGLRRIQFYLLNSSGYPSGDQSGATPYDGVNLEGPRSMNINGPDVRRVQHVGNDRLIAQDYLPPTDGVSADITTAKQNLAADATMTDASTINVGQTTMGGMYTDKQGEEPDLCVIAYRQALNTTAGSSSTRVWQTYMFPVSRMVPRGASPQEGGADENAYSLTPSVATSPPWGTAFTAITTGYTEAQYLRFTSENPPMMDAWTGNGTLTTFTLSWTPISTAKTAVIVNGVAASVSSVDTSNKTVTVSVAPANDSAVVAWYETTDDI